MLTNPYYSPDHGTKSSIEYYENFNNYLPDKNISKKIKIINQLNDFKLLKDNWDSYNASPISEALIQEAIKYVNKLDKMKIDVYYTAPSPSGDILIELRSNNKTVEIEFLSEGNRKFASYIYDELIKSDLLNSNTESELLAWYRE